LREEGKKKTGGFGVLNHHKSNSESMTPHPADLAPNHTPITRHNTNHTRPPQTHTVTPITQHTAQHTAQQHQHTASHTAHTIPAPPVRTPHIQYRHKASFSQSPYVADSLSEEIGQNFYAAERRAAAAVDDHSVGHAHGLPLAQSLALEARLPGRGLFSSLVELLDLYKRGRDAFIDYLAKNPTLHGSSRVISQKRKRGDKDGDKEGDKEGIIYALVNLANKKLYVRQTNNFGKRMSRHFTKSGKKSCVKSAIVKYGREQFVSVILLAGIEQREELNLTEKEKKEMKKGRG
jgi:hypothetical protein